MRKFPPVQPLAVVWDRLVSKHGVGGWAEAGAVGPRNFSRSPRPRPLDPPPPPPGRGWGPNTPIFYYWKFILIARKFFPFLSLTQLQVNWSPGPKTILLWDQPLLFSMTLIVWAKISFFNKIAMRERRLIGLKLETNDLRETDQGLVSTKMEAKKFWYWCRKVLSRGEESQLSFFSTLRGSQFHKLALTEKILQIIVHCDCTRCCFWTPLLRNC